MIKIILAFFLFIAFCDAQNYGRGGRASLTSGRRLVAPRQQARLQARPRPRPRPAPVPSYEENYNSEGYEPYSYNYDNTDEYGTRLAKNEEGDGSGRVTGRYEYRDANGYYRIVEYYADETGFHPTIISNEPGLISHTSGSATYQVE